MARFEEVRRKRDRVENNTEYLRANGFCRACSVAIPLRAAGFNVERFPILKTYYDRKTKRERFCYVNVPWAKVWAVNLAKDLRKFGIDAKIRKAVLKEALELGRPGPLAESVLVAGRMMK